MSVTTTIQIVAGDKYWINYAGRPEECRVLSIIEQQGVTLIKFRVGIPLIGTVTVEPVKAFWGRMVKR